MYPTDMKTGSGKTGLPVPRHWFRVKACPGQITRINEKYIHPYWAGTIWLVYGSERGLVVDTGTGIVPPGPFIEGISKKPLMAVALCDFYDHAGGLYSFDHRACHLLEADAIAAPGGGRVGQDTAESIRNCIRRLAGLDLPRYEMTGTNPTRLVEDGDIIDLGNRKLEVLHIPGRTPGSIALWEPGTGFLFGGESLFVDPENNHFPVFEDSTTLPSLYDSNAQQRSPV